MHLRIVIFDGIMENGAVDFAPVPFSNYYVFGRKKKGNCELNLEMCY